MMGSGVGLGFGYWCQTLCSVDVVWVEGIERICLTPSGEFGWAGLSESVLYRAESLGEQD